jgi:hypothetical protein
VVPHDQDAKAVPIETKPKMLGKPRQIHPPQPASSGLKSLGIRRRQPREMLELRIKLIRQPRPLFFRQPQGMPLNLKNRAHAATLPLIREKTRPTRPPASTFSPQPKLKL